LNTIYAAITTTNAVSIRVGVTTYNGATQIGTTQYKTGTATIINANPTFSTAATYTDTNTTIQTLLGTTSPKTLLQLKSTPSVTAGTASAVRSATIASYRVRHGTTQSTSATATIAVTADKVDFNTNTTVYVDVIDSRGNVGTQTLLWVVKPYTSPARTTNLAYRQNNYGTTGFIEISWDVQSIVVSTEKNTGSAEYRVKAVGGAYGSATAITDTPATSGGRLNYSKTSGDGGVVTIGITLAANTAYVIELGIWDSVETTKILYEIPVGKATPAVQFLETDIKVNGTSVWEMVYPVGAIYMSVLSTSPATLFGGTWAALQNSFLVGAGGTYSVGKADDAGAQTTSDGGEATHTLSAAEMPVHTHTQDSHYHAGIKWKDNNYPIVLSNLAGTTAGYTTGYASITADPSGILTVGATATNQNAGSGSAHNTLPPYLAVYMWKRTA
jgi:microcystin-dependent protein